MNKIHDTSVEIFHNFLASPPISSFFGMSILCSRAYVMLVLFFLQFVLLLEVSRCNARGRLSNLLLFLSRLLVDRRIFLTMMRR